jgi:hypothetical protein
MPSDGKSSPGLWPSELKNTIKIQNKLFYKNKLQE